MLEPYVDIYHHAMTVDVLGFTAHKKPKAAREDSHHFLQKRSWGVCNQDFTVAADETVEEQVFGFRPIQTCLMHVTVEVPVGTIKFMLEKRCML